MLPPQISLHWHRARQTSNETSRRRTQSRHQNTYERRKRLYRHRPLRSQSRSHHFYSTRHSQNTIHQISSNCIIPSRTKGRHPPQKGQRQNDSSILLRRLLDFKIHHQPLLRHTIPHNFLFLIHYLLIIRSRKALLAEKIRPHHQCRSMGCNHHP